MSLRKPFKRGPVWYCEVDRRRVSLKTKDKAEALSRFAEIRRRYLQQLVGTPIRSECLMTIGDFADEYMEWAPKAIKSPNTVNNAFIALKKLLAITKRSLPLSDVHPKHIDLLIAANRDRKSSSINCYIRFSRIVMNKAVSWGYIKENPFRSVKYLREDIEPPRFIPPDEVMRFLNGIRNIDNRRLTTAFIFSGRRRSELLALRWENIRMEKEEYFIESTISKSNVSRWYPMHPMFKAVLLAIGEKESGPVFEKWKRVTSITAVIKKELKAGGYPDLSLHKLRHTFATLLKEHGVDLDTIGDLLGHSNRSATEIYAHITPTRQRTALSAIPCEDIALDS